MLDLLGESMLWCCYSLLVSLIILTNSNVIYGAVSLIDYTN